MAHAPRRSQFINLEGKGIMTQKKSTTKGEDERGERDRLATSQKRDPTERLRRMKLRRAGHPAPLARPEPGGDYCVIEFNGGGGLAEYGYTKERFFLVRKDVEPEPGDFVVVEREPTMYEGRALRLDGDDGVRAGIFGRNEDGSPRLESLTCGAYTYRLKRIVGKVIGPCKGPAVLDDLDDAPADGEWPEYIGGDEWPEYVDDGRAT